jgi:hypothetical protein
MKLETSRDRKERSAISTRFEKKAPLQNLDHTYNVIGSCSASEKANFDDAFACKFAAMGSQFSLSKVVATYKILPAG